MNRDDALSRTIALPPELHAAGMTKAVYPREDSAGTWIASNAAGVTLALLNWNRPKLTPKLRSRGGVIPALIGLRTASALERALKTTNLNGIWPFRLIGFFPVERTVREWRWNGMRLTRRNHPWKRNHWFSSGLSDVKAARERQPICQSRASATLNLTSLRNLHRQHGSEPGPFSICVHRKDAATLSYTEIVLRRQRLIMRYAAGQPCKSHRPAQFASAELRISTADFSILD